MARGQYELPIGYRKPTYGPRRPPTGPTTASATCRSALSSSTPARQTPGSSTQCPTLLVVLSLTRSDEAAMQLAKLKHKIGPHAIIEEVGSMDDAIAALSRWPSAVFVNEALLTDPSHEPLRLAVARYMQHSGVLLTDQSQIAAFLERCATAARHDSVHAALLPEAGKVPTAA